VAVWNPLEYLNQEDEREEQEEDSPLFLQLFSKADSLLRGYGFEPDFGIREDDIHIVGAEVGDDRVDLCNYPAPLGIALVAQELVFDMRTSYKDTYVSNADFNFCEVTTCIPCAREESFSYAKKTSLDQLGFNDATPLRIVIDVAKGDRSHSSTSVGKASLLGRRLSTPRTSNRLNLQIASWLQDSCLNTSLSSEPKYIANVIAGSGCPPLFDEPDNAYLYMKSFRGGTYERVYGSAIHEAQLAVRNLDSGQPGATPLCQRLREKQEYLHGTYAATVFIPERIKPPEFPQPLYKAVGTQAYLQGMEARLGQAKLILPEKQARVEYDRGIRVSTTLFHYEGVVVVDAEAKFASKQRRAEHEEHLRANSAFQHLLSRVANDEDALELHRAGWLSSSAGVRYLTRDLVKWMTEGGKGEVYTIADLTPSQDIYLREEVSLEDTLRIAGVPLAPIANHRVIETTTIAHVGLWQINQSQLDWAQQITAELVQLREERHAPLLYDDVHRVVWDHREWINDDTLLVQHAFAMTRGLPRGTLVLITNDRKLSQNMAKSVGFYVIVITPPHVLTKFRAKALSAETIDAIALEDVLPWVQRSIVATKETPRPDFILIDTGSFAHTAMQVEVGRNSLGGTTGAYYRKKLVDAEHTVVGREATYLKELLLTRSTTPAVIVSPNGEVQRISIYDEGNLPEPEGPITNRSRQGRLSRLTSRVTSSARAWTGISRAKGT
jgi:hypothetical protein